MFGVMWRAEVMCRGLAQLLELYDRHKASYGEPGAACLTVVVCKGGVKLQAYGRAFAWRSCRSCTTGTGQLR